jgi:hypothetical protein
LSAVATFLTPFCAWWLSTKSSLGSTAAPESSWFSEDMTSAQHTPWHGRLVRDDVSGRAHRELSPPPARAGDAGWSDADADCWVTQDLLRGLLVRSVLGQATL